MDDERVAVLVPGAGYTAQGPLLAYARLGVERRGAQARVISWSPPSLDDATQWVAWVRERVLEALGNDTALIIGKSLGSMAAGLAAERELPAVWLTPLLHRPEVVEAIGAAHRPPLLVGGTGDRTWDGAVARRLSPHVVEIPDADHALYVPGAVARTAATAGRVAQEIEDFLDRHVWPGLAQAAAR
jgi:pimeloyl-ACP methyl ester carboxylesterase